MKRKDTECPICGKMNPIKGKTSYGIPEDGGFCPGECTKIFETTLKNKKHVCLECAKTIMNKDVDCWYPMIDKKLSQPICKRCQKKIDKICEFQNRKKRFTSAKLRCTRCGKEYDAVISVANTKRTIKEDSLFCNRCCDDDDEDELFEKELNEEFHDNQKKGKNRLEDTKKIFKKKR